MNVNGTITGPAPLDVAEATAIGRIASPQRSESTSVRCYFWVPKDRLVEKTQLVRAVSTIAGKEIAFYGLVEEVYRRSRKRSMDEEVDTFDGKLDYEPPFGEEGVTFAEVSILHTEPPYLTPPLEQSIVYPGTEVDAGIAYGFGDMIEREDGKETDWSLPIGLLRNGADGTVGVARIDLRDLTGDRAGHLNVTGQAGRGTKSSFLMVVVRALIDRAQAWDDGNPHKEPFSVRPIVFNVKGYDLMFIDAPNRGLTAIREAQWWAMRIEPRPFTEARFVSPCTVGQGPVNRGQPRVDRGMAADRAATPYYWTLADVVRFGLWPYLFSDAAQTSESLMAMVDHVLGKIADDITPDARHPAGLRLRPAAPQSFSALREWLRDALKDKMHEARDDGIHTFATCRALLSRLGLVLDQEGRSIFDPGAGEGRPLNVIDSTSADPLVIDIAALPSELRRFVVAAVLDQVKAHQMGPRRTRGRVYFLVLDELGIYAPRGARDPITKLFEHVAAQLRSQGIILLGAQQHASQVSETIFGNSEFKVLGGSSPVELESPTWSRLLTSAQKDRAARLRPNEKMALTGRGWMNLVVPYPAWAMKESEIDRATLGSPAATINGTPVAGFGFVPPRD